MSKLIVHFVQTEDDSSLLLPDVNIIAATAKQQDVTDKFVVILCCDNSTSFAAALKTACSGCRVVHARELLNESQQSATLSRTRFVALLNAAASLEKASRLASVHVWGSGCIFTLDHATSELCAYSSCRARLVEVASRNEAREWFASASSAGRRSGAKRLLDAVDSFEGDVAVRFHHCNAESREGTATATTFVVPPTGNEVPFAAPRAACITAAHNVSVLKFEHLPQLENDEDGDEEEDVITGALGRILLWLGTSAGESSVLHMSTQQTGAAATKLLVRPQLSADTVRQLAQHFPSFRFSCNGVSFAQHDSSDSKVLLLHFACINLIGEGVSSVASNAIAPLVTLGAADVFRSPNGCCFAIALPQDSAAALLPKIHDAVFDTGANKHETEGRTRQRPFTEWWATTKRERLLQLATEKTPLYVYDSTTILRAVASLKNLPAIGRVNYAMKANPFPPVLRLMYAQGVCFDCVSFGEVEHLRASLSADAAPFDPKRVVFTPNFAPLSEYRAAFELGCYVTVDNLELLRQAPELFANRDILVRIDPDTPQVGHHTFVQTSGSSTKFGLSQEHVAAFAQQCEHIAARVIGLHAHVGSGIFAPETWARTARFLSKVKKQHFPDACIIDVGGGFGVPDTDEQPALDLATTNRLLEEFRAENPDVTLWTEPGRFLVARAGVLLAKVTQTKQKCGTSFVGIDTGINTLIRYPLYGSFHEVVNFSKLDEEHAIVADVVGPICETGDVLGKQRSFPPTSSGDVLLIANAGAYGKSMSSSYNMRSPAEEVLLD